MTLKIGNVELENNVILAPMAGVTVVVEGSTIGTSSDADGRYVLKIPAGIYNIMFSCIGYESHVKRYNGQNLADFRKI